MKTVDFSEIIAASDLKVSRCGRYLSKIISFKKNDENTFWKTMGSLS